MNNLTNIFWDLFRSVRLTLVLLILLAVASILGTLIPQGEGAMQFARSLSPGLVRLFNALDLFDMYHSFWFRFLIGILVLNLVICSTDRFPAALKRYRSSSEPHRERAFEDLPSGQTLVVPAGMEDTASRVERFMRNRYGMLRKKVDGDRHFYVVEKGRYAHFCVYLVHASVLVILVGALVGSFFGFEARVSLAEGEQTDTVFLTKNKAPLKLGFEVRCDKFSVDFYDNGSPNEYRSELTFLINGREMERGSLLVNHPVEFSGVRFYQSSYGNLPGGEVLLRIERPASKPKGARLKAEVGTPVRLPGSNEHFRVLEVDRNLRGKMGPAALISIHPEQGNEIRFWIFQSQEILRLRFPPQMLQSPILNPSAFKPYTFFLEGIETRFYTGLQANRDPGVGIVWIGCALMICGFCFTFFTSHRRIRIRLSKEKKGVRVDVAGTASKNPVLLERELEHLVNKLKTSLVKDIKHV